MEPYFNWQGSMMSQASRDILFEANMVIANQDAPDSGDLCLRCHLYRGWLRGRSVPTDGSQMLSTDEIGVACDLCHRMVDPVFRAGESNRRCSHPGCSELSGERFRKRNGHHRPHGRAARAFC